MSKYIVEHTSLWGNEKPCDGAIKETLTYMDERTTSLGAAKRAFWFPNFIKSNDSYEEIGGKLVGYCKREAWTIDTTIEEMCEKEGPLVIAKSDYVEVPIAIEIYDEYRE